MPWGCSVWRRHIHFSSRTSRSSSDFIPDSRMNTSISSFLCPVWKCSASSVLSGLFLMSYRCLPNLTPRVVPEWPMYIRSHFLQRTAYMIPSVLQFPPSFSSIVMFFFVFVMVELVQMSLQRIQEPQGEVDVGFFSAGRMSCRTM